MYHSHGVDPFAVTAEEFERQLAYLSGRFEMVRLADLEFDLDDQFSRPVCCLTFDDGYLDHHAVTAPLLERFGIKATFFIAPGLLRQESAASGGGRFMTPCQVAELADLGHEIGAHSVSHVRLTNLPASRARMEIEESKRSLEQLTGAAVESFSFPYGAHDALRAEMVRNAGFARAVTTVESHVREGVDPFRLPRVAVTREVRLVDFRRKVSPAMDLYRLIRF